MKNKTKENAESKRYAGTSGSVSCRCPDCGRFMDMVFATDVGTKYKPWIVCIDCSSDYYEENTFPT